MPTVYQSRLGISLYDAQYDGNRKIPIPSDVISTIISALKQFKQTSVDFGVPQRSENVRILATEATRTATNSQAFIQSIEAALGSPWKVNLLAKEDEGRIGALGVVSSVGGTEGLEGLMMDLGGSVDPQLVQIGCGLLISVIQAAQLNLLGSSPVQVNRFKRLAKAVSRFHMVQQH